MPSRRERAEVPRDPLVFVVGCPRSGTTLLQRILDHHPELAIANDTHFVTRVLDDHDPRAAERVMRGEPIPLEAGLVERVRGYRRMHRLGLGDEMFVRAAARSRTYAEFVGAVYEAHAAQHGKAYGGEKTPDFVRRLPLLHALCPNSKFVHIVRDGRDVALSLVNWATPTKGPGRLPCWNDDPLALAMLWWRWQVTSGREDATLLRAGSVLELDYAELVGTPVEVTVRICSFLGLPYVESMNEYHAGRRRDEAGLSAKAAWLPPVGGLRDWRTQMDEPDQALFELLAGDLREELGHPRGASSASPTVRGRADAARARFDEVLRRKAAKRASRTA